MKIVCNLGSLGLALASFALIACSEGGDAPSPAPKPAPSPPRAEAPSTPTPPTTPAAPVEESPEQLAARGRGVYMSNCIACHNMDPKLEGALGPAVAGSSRELLEARVLRAEYPAGYTPKRDSKQMVALPHLAKEIDSLTAYLNQ